VPLCCELRGVDDVDGLGAVTVDGWSELLPEDITSRTDVEDWVGVARHLGRLSSTRHSKQPLPTTCRNLSLHTRTIFETTRIHSSHIKIPQNTTNYSYFVDVSVSITDLHQKNLVLILLLQASSGL